MREGTSKTTRAGERAAWVSPSVTYVGHVGDIVQGGGGKSSTQPTDPGEPMKVKPPNPEGN
ncbi:MAG TPA: hypothetical protein VJ813_15145 [Vicinamibacterales bacterium]|nr:hypothetical protein [Vicinamibacterales bacterium]